MLTENVTDKSKYNLVPDFSGHKVQYQ